ncbi:hypothetical protein BDC45DRAFT_540378 [Circinella umbellata]|nr:hypothetical protein BDC45DRAFT_540378 [Circinella umbellata]
MLSHKWVASFLIVAQRPGTDLMSKLILLKPEVTNLIIEKFVESFVRPHAVDKYKGILTEWPNLMKSDVMYEPFSYNDLIQYCLQMIKRYPVLPIIVVIGINSTTQDILEMVGKEDPEVLFSASLPCTGWANCFYLLNGGTIRTYLDCNPIEPTVALAHFFIEQELSLISMERHEDPTIQMLL